ncbi:uncharacterized protein MYCFIDRAFT_177572 [Pseudocercospora fijiensis CIRAD86]|uniref:Uncharacterized protein n=1 Tax=Pseudocercospora fijiensis (strain CIRAD86) TaxID=383855 RepID=M2YSE1_PSEFD|nr:uncharacterized protein MYCFIDRAFT_177572 [Pseudocercospora fijiensis CIRAD86]EME80640.1 hypothetical protein MYCFIDRAFT_177572 [Pseudocercospora fijiensis CIRAD86]
MVIWNRKDLGLGRQIRDYILSLYCSMSGSRTFSWGKARKRWSKLTVPREISSPLAHLLFLLLHITIIIHRNNNTPPSPHHPSNHAPNHRQHWVCIVALPTINSKLSPLTLIPVRRTLFMIIAAGSSPVIPTTAVPMPPHSVPFLRPRHGEDPAARTAWQAASISHSSSFKVALADTSPPEHDTTRNGALPRRSHAHRREEAKRMSMADQKINSMV